MKFIAVSLALLLGGCACQQELIQPSVVTVNRYLVPSLGTELTSVPPQPPAINLDTATQREVANWLLDSEQRIVILENKLRAAGQAYEALIKKKNLKPEDYEVVDLSKELDLKKKVEEKK